MKQRSGKYTHTAKRIICIAIFLCASWITHRHHHSLNDKCAAERMHREIKYVCLFTFGKRQMQTSWLGGLF